MAASPVVQEVVRRCEAEYRHWHKVRYIARERGVEPEIVWLLVRLGREARHRELPLTGEFGVPLRYTVPDVVQRELTLVDQQLAGRITLDEDGSITAGERDRYVVSSLMEEAIASSKLEGASTLHRVAKEMLRRNREPRDKHERMIVNNYRAILHVRERCHEALTPEALIELQRILTEGTLEREHECGRLRRAGEDVVVADTYGEVLHEPPPASELPERLERLCAFANEPPMRAEPFVHPLIRASVLHFQLAYDHPFCDGNGRTARVLFYWLMLRSGYWMFEFLPISRLIYHGPSDYQRAFQYVETDAFDVTYFVVYTAKLVARARRELASYLARKRSELQAARRVFDREGLNDRQRQLLFNWMEAADRAMTIEEHQHAAGISYHTARADLIGLESLGYIRHRKVGKKFVFLLVESGSN